MDERTGKERTLPSASPPTGNRDGRLLLISTAPPRRFDRWLGVAVVLGLVCALLATVPFAQIQLPASASLVPAYLSAVLINQLTTAVLLFGLYRVERSRRVLVLAGGYLFAGLMIIPWAVTFPGAFPSFQLDTGLQATATVAALNRLGFPLFILVYAMTRDRPPSEIAGAAGRTIAGTVALVVAAVAVIGGVVLFTDVPLPPFMRDAHTVAPLWSLVPPAALAICVAGLVALGTKRRSVLDLWLMVVLASLVIEILLLGYISAGTRLSVGWWAGRAYGLTSASIVLVVLLSGMTTLYARLARSVLAERRVRESRLTVMEAFSASIAHEMRQPLISIVLSAAAGRRWLRRDPPDLAEVEAALLRIEAVGERAGQLVETIRSAYRSNPATHGEAAVSEVLADVLARCREEAELDRVAVRTELAEDLPAVAIDPIKLHLVLSNLIGNAIDAMVTVSGRARLLSIATCRSGNNVVLSIADTGTGLTADEKDRAFSTFFTTKPDGMGVGLMFCRSIVETTGGRISVTDNEPHGAVFHVSLPVAASDPG